MKKSDLKTGYISVDERKITIEANISEIEEMYSKKLGKKVKDKVVK